MILNLTQHKATPEQALAGVVDLTDGHQAALHELLTFEILPTPAELHHRAAAIAAMATQYAGTGAMIGGAPYLMPLLEGALRQQHLQPLYAFSRRVSREETLPDGSVKKIATFRHEGFVGT